MKAKAEHIKTHWMQLKMWSEYICDILIAHARKVKRSQIYELSFHLYNYGIKAQIKQKQKKEIIIITEKQGERKNNEKILKTNKLVQRNDQ